MRASFRFAVQGCALLLIVAVRPLVAQDPVKVAPDNYKTLLENDHVRVLEVRAKPGEKVALHSHPDHAAYVLSAGKMKLTGADGTSKDVDNKLGDVKWIKAEAHSGENVGTTEFRGIVVELRDPAPKPGQATHGVPAAEDPAKLSADTTKVLFENERIRITEATLKAGGKMPVHSHPPHVLYVVSGGGKIKATAPDGKVTETEVAPGQTTWSDAVKHAIENAGQDAKSIAFELKQPG
jgi:quercetin dioxygenase-like cupin family protein